jgi:hypothetical protein
MGVSGNGDRREMAPERVERQQKLASMFGCALYLAAALVLGGIFLLHLLRR